MFWRRKVKGEPPVGEILERLGKLESTMRQLELEQIEMHDGVRRWMRRAVAAERAAGRNQERSGTAAPDVTPVPPPTLRGARLRAWQQGRIWGQPALSISRPEATVSDEDAGEGTNGVHP